MLQKVAGSRSTFLLFTAKTITLEQAKLWGSGRHVFQTI